MGHLSEATVESFKPMCVCVVALGAALLSILVAWRDLAA